MWDVVLIRLSVYCGKAEECSLGSDDAVSWDPSASA